MPKKTCYLYTRLLRYVKPFLAILVCGIAANIVYISIDASLTYMMKVFIEKGFIHIDSIFVKQIPWLLLIAIIVRGTVSALGSYCMTWVARSVVKVLRQELFAHIIKLPAKYYDSATSGQLLSKILYDVEQVAQVSADALTDFVQNTFLIIGLLIVMFMLCWQLSLMFLIAIPFVAIIVDMTNKRIRKLSHRIQKNMSEVTEIAGEAIDGYRVIRIFGGAQHELNKFNTATESSRINDMKVALSKALNVVGVQFVVAICIAIIILMAIKLSTVVTISAGAFIAIIAAMLQLIKPLKTLTTLNTMFQRGLAGAESIFALLDEFIESGGNKTLALPVQGNINFEKVNFAYVAQQPVLHDINFNIYAGEKVAIVGASGSGKTTLASLLPKFYQLTNGKITIDGIDINELSLVDLRQHIALVSQNITLFNDTIANNIAYGCRSVSHESIIEVAKSAYIHDFIQNLPNGYATKIGENGLLLSGGQRQRLAIARAMLKNSRILLLDEATSSLDSESESYIQAALNIIMAGRTTLIIAHRLSTIKNANKILVLHHGKIMECGPHDELLALQGYYYNLYHGKTFRENLASIIA